jgi:hypothetical protein
MPPGLIIYEPPTMTRVGCSEIKRRQTENDYCGEKDGDHVGFLAACGFAPMLALALAIG